MVCYTLDILWLVSFLFPILVTFYSTIICGVLFAVFHIRFYSSYTAILYGVYIVPVIIQSTRVRFYQNICVPTVLQCGIGYLYLNGLIEYYYECVHIYQGLYPLYISVISSPTLISEIAVRYHRLPSCIRIQLGFIL